jgi:hypothetical protein
MEMVNLVNNTVTDYFKKYGVGKPNYIGNWADSFPKDFYQTVRNYEWDFIPERNYDNIFKALTDENLVKELADIGHFKNWKTTSHGRWKIINSSDINLNLTLLHTHIRKHLTKYKLSIARIPAGCCIPQHVDTIDSFVDSYSIPEYQIKNIKRIMILLHDTKPWHHLWYGNYIIPADTVAGDAWEFNFWEPHGGSNLGPDAKFTLQVIGINTDPDDQY